MPVVLPGQSVDGVPDFLAPATSTAYSVPELTNAGVTPLLRLLLDQPEETEPPLGTAPILDTRAPAPPSAPLLHRIEVHVESDGTGVRVRTELAGAVLGEHVAPLPSALVDCWAELNSPTGGDRLATLGRSLWDAMFDEPTGRHLEELVVGSPFGTVVDVVAVLPTELAWLPVELLRRPDGRLAAAVPGV